MIGVLLTVIACGIILVLFFSFLRSNARYPQAPGILTMVGIAGTFLGIAVGLSGFDSSDLASGVPRLIDGMKVAVWASFTGVCTAIILRLVDTFRQPLDRESAPIAPRGTLDDTPRDGADHSDEVLAELRLMRRDLGERIARVERALDLFPERTAKLLAAELKSRQQQDES